MIKKWQFSNKISLIEDKKDAKAGFCYAVRIKVIPGFYLTKIGATTTKGRFSNIPRAKLYCLSPPHLNYFKNEEKLHHHFAKYRVPRKPGGKSQVELFNIDLPYFF